MTHVVKVLEVREEIKMKEAHLKEVKEVIRVMRDKDLKVLNLEVIEDGIEEEETEVEVATEDLHQEEEIEEIEMIEEEEIEMIEEEEVIEVMIEGIEEEAGKEEEAETIEEEVEEEEEIKVQT